MAEAQVVRVGGGLAGQLPARTLTRWKALPALQPAERVCQQAKATTRAAAAAALTLQELDLARELALHVLRRAWAAARRLRLGRRRLLALQGGEKKSAAVC